MDFLGVNEWEFTWLFMFGFVGSYVLILLANPGGDVMLVVSPLLIIEGLAVAGFVWMWARGSGEQNGT